MQQKKRYFRFRFNVDGALVFNGSLTAELGIPSRDQREAPLRKRLRRGIVGCCEIEDGPAIAAQTDCRLACDASVVAVIEMKTVSPWMSFYEPGQFIFEEPWF
jgi:hypothetical protein